MSLSMAASVRRLFVMGAAAVLATGLFAGPVGAQDIPTGGDLTIGIEGDIVAMDPAFAYDFTANPVVAEVTEGLLKFQDGKVVPNLAESVEVSEDGLTWTYKIRQGVKFHDGTDMTVDDVVYSMERTRNPDTGSYVGWMYGCVDTIEATDASTVVVTLKNNDAFWQYVPATTAGHIISKAFAEAHPEDIGQAGRRRHRHRSLQVRLLVQRRPDRPVAHRRLLGQGQRRPVPGHRHVQGPDRRDHPHRRPPDR